MNERLEGPVESLVESPVKGSGRRLWAFLFKAALAVVWVLTGITLLLALFALFLALGCVSDGCIAPVFICGVAIRAALLQGLVALPLYWVARTQAGEPQRPLTTRWARASVAAPFVMFFIVYVVI